MAGNCVSCAKAVMAQCFVFTFLSFWLYSQDVSAIMYYPTVFWTPNNCWFKTNNQKNEKSYYFKVRPNSQIYFVCPNVAIWGDASTENPHLARMYENLLLVDKESYESCSIRNRTDRYHNKIILLCNDRPNDEKIRYTHEIFSSSQADPDKVKYEPGRDYYFISTSDGTMGSLTNTAGGHCKTHHMKLHIYLCNYTEKCNFEMPDCQFDDPMLLDDFTKKNDIFLPTKVTEPVIKEARADIWMGESKHLIIHIVTALLVLVLLIVISFLSFKLRKQTRINKKNEEDGQLVSRNANNRQEAIII